MTETRTATVPATGPVRPLSGIRILDLSRGLGAYCSRLLTGLGADVVKVEPPEGDQLRGDAENASLLFDFYYRGVRSVTVDLQADDAAELLGRLAADVDAVVLEPVGGPAVPGFDLNSGVLGWAPETAVVCCLTPFGRVGPWREFRTTPLVSYALSGLMWRLGPPEGPPKAPPGRQLVDQLGAHAAASILAALRDREVVGGQLIDLSLHELQSAQDDQIDRYDLTGAFGGRASPIASAPPSGIWPCADGIVEIVAHNPAHWDGFVQVLGSPADLLDPALRQRSARLARADELAAIVRDRLAGAKVREIVAECQARGVPSSEQFEPADLVTDPHAVDRGFWVDVPLAGGGPARYPGLPFRSDPPLFEIPPPAPRRGAHDAEIGRELGIGLPAGNDVKEPGQPTETPAAVGDVERGDLDAASGSMAAAGLRPDGLAGIRVLSFGTAIAGNVTAMTLAELGCDVVKVESPDRPDPLRVQIYADVPPVVEPGGAQTNIMFAGFSRSVRGVALDMKDDNDRQAFANLLTVADVLIDNFATGVLDRLGLGVDRLRQINPSLVHVSVSGYGRTGPRSRYLAYGTNVNAYVGFSRAWVPHGTQLDYAAVAHALPAVLAGLAYRDRTGSGVRVDLAQYEAGACLAAPMFLSALNPAHPAANPPESVLAGVFRSRGDDRWVAVEIESPQDWATVCELIGVPELVRRDDADTPLAPSPEEVSTGRATLEQWCAQHTPHQAMVILQRRGIAAGAVHDAEDMYRDPQHRASGFFAPVVHPDLGTIEYPNPFQHLRRSGVGVRRPAPRVGQHTDEVIEEWGKGDRRS